MKEPYQLTNYLIILLIVAMSCQTDKKETSESAEEGQQPNILLIVADDMGYSDIGPFGGEINRLN